MSDKSTIGVKTDTHYADIHEFREKGNLHLQALIDGPNFQGLPDKEMDPDYVTDAVADAQFQMDTAQGLRAQIENDFPA